MKMKLWVAIASLALWTAVPLGAHHSWTADYDGGKPVTVKGVVTKVEWTNPHTHFYVEAKDEKGTITMWNFEMASPNILERNGWTRKAVKAMDTVVVEGYAGRVDASRGIANSIKFGDGRALFAGAPDQQNN